MGQARGSCVVVGLGERSSLMSSDRPYALVTGASRGIGRALTELLLEKQWQVYACDLSTDPLVDLQLQYKDQLKVLEADVREVAAFSEAVRGLESQRRFFDLWINCAGISGIGEFTKTSKADFDKVVQVNLTAVVDLTRIAVQHMNRRGKGTICNLASVAGFVPAPLMTAYCLTKHAVVGFSRSLQAELEMSGSPVKVLLVSPGFVDTEILQKGQPVGFPEWLSPVLAKPQSVAAEILAAYAEGRTEVFPTLNGKVMMAIGKWAPWVLQRSRRLLMARKLSDVFLNRF